MNLDGAGSKNPNKINLLGFKIWWRRRELNPRPSALCHQLYMFRTLYLVNLKRPGGQGVKGDLLKFRNTNWSGRGS